MPSTYDSDRAKARGLFRLRPSPAMIPERMGIIGRTHGVNASNTPKTRKLARTSAKLPSNNRAISMSLAKSENRDEVLAGGVVAPDIAPDASAAARTICAVDSIGI